MREANSRAMRIADAVPVIMGAFHDIRPPRPEEEVLTMRQYQALIVVHVHGALSLGEFCEKLGLAPSTGTELANRLVAKGFLVKGSGGRDRRQAILRLNDQGQRITQERKDLLVDVFAEFMDRFEEKDQEESTRCFGRIAELIRKYHP